MQILMLDKNHLTDRRIVLEAKSLMKNGHQVNLVELRTSDQPAHENISGLSVWRFFPEQLMEETEKNTAANSLENSSTKNWRNKLAMIIHRQISSSKIANVFLFALYPSQGVKQIPYTQIPTALKSFLLLFYSVLSLSTNNISYAVRTIYSQIFRRLGKQRALAELKKITDLSTKLSRAADLLPFDYWEQQVVKQIGKTLPLPDIIHAHDYPALPLAVQLAELLNVPIIYDAHELFSYQPGFPEIVRQKIFNHEKNLVKHCQSIIVVNQDQAKIMQKDFAVNRFTIVSNATEEPENFDVYKKYNLIREKTGIPEDQVILIFQGGVSRLRKVDLLFEGLAKTPSHIHLAMLSYGKELPEFKKLANELGLQNRIHFLTPVPWQEIIFWIASADAGIMPYQPLDQNTAISSPNKMFEYILAGIPMIASSGLINVRKVLEIENFGVLKNLITPDDYAAAINEMFDDKLGGAARFRHDILQRRHSYLWQHEERELLKLYDGLAIKYAKSFTLRA